MKLVVQFRGREMAHPETGRAVLDRVCKDTVDLATVIQMASMERNRMNMVIAPKARKDGGGAQARPKRPQAPRPDLAADPASAPAPRAQAPAAPPASAPAKTEAATPPPAETPAAGANPDAESN